MSIASLALAQVREQTPRPLPHLGIADSGQGGGAKQEGDDDKKSALETLTHYIPTEIITLYVAALAAKPALKSTVEGWFGPGHLHAIGIYWICIVLTPLLYLLVYVSGRFQHNQGLPSLKQLPWWSMFAATLAFMAWGLSVPTNPVIRSDVASAVAGLFSLFLSMVLTLLDPVFDPTKRDKAATNS